MSIEGIKKKYENTNYILLEFKSKNAKDKDIFYQTDYGIINLDLAIDWKSVFRELVNNAGHKVIGGNFPAKETSANVAEAYRTVRPFIDLQPKQVKEKPAEKKTKEKVEEVKEKLANK